MALDNGCRSAVKLIASSESSKSVSRGFLCVKRIGGGHGHSKPDYIHSYVTEDITINAISSLNDGSCLSFTDADLPQNGSNHNMALHISVTCGETTLTRVLVDTGSALNVIPKTTLDTLQVGATMEPSSLIAKAFDGSLRRAMGVIDLPVFIGPQLFNITFQVMDIFPSYSCLLGRPWIHGAKAVTSTLHQKLKFLVNNQVVEVSGEDVYLGDEVHETIFQAFEIVGNVQKPKGNILHNPLAGSSFEIVGGSY